jgi:transposase
MRFEEAYGDWQAKRLTQEEAARLLGVHERTFRRYLDRYEEDGLEGRLDQRLTPVSPRRAPVDEVMRLTDRYRSRHQGWNVKHFYTGYRKDEKAPRRYPWVRSRLQEAGLVKKAKGRGTHRQRRERSPLPGLMIHQEGSTHEGVPGQQWDLIVTMDDATNEHYSMLFCAEEGTRSRLLGVRDVMESRGLFSTFYSDRGSHYGVTPEAGGQVDKKVLS